MKKLRLVMTYDCPRDCHMCCNKEKPFREQDVKLWDWRLDGFDELILTGGEPLLNPLRLYSLLVAFRLNNVKITKYLYTAKTCDLDMFFRILRHLNGVTFTLHEQDAVEDFLRFNFELAPMRRWIQDNNKSMQLHIFKGVDLLFHNPTFWKIKRDIEWIPNCPLPEGEIIRKM